jgi:predicted alpha-1,2-mannosidase
VLLALLLACGRPLPDPGSASLTQAHPAAPLTLEVDPLIGTAREGQTFPGAVRPWGMASPSPHNRRTSFDEFIRGGLQANAGYVHGQPEIHGFGLAHVSGNGCPDHGAPVVSVSTTELPTGREGSRSAYDSEVARAGYYAVRLARFDIRAEMTSTPRTGAFRFFFPSGEVANIVVDTGRSLSWREDQGRVRVVDARTIEGSVGLGHSCAARNESRLHFILRADRDALETGTIRAGSVSAEHEAEGDALGFLRFQPERGDPVEIRIGLSWVSIEGARANLEAESAGRSFADLHEEAARDWQDRLGRVQIEGGSPEERRRFYTALYHSLIHPSVVSDVDGGYVRFGSNDIGSSPGEPRYSLFSLWDTYRTVHPLLTLLYPETQLAILRSLVDMTEAAGAPPLWEIAGDEVQMMVGDPVPVVVADSVAKGLTDFDIESLYRMLAQAAERPDHRPGIDLHRRLGFVPMESHETLWGPASMTLEYAIADHGLARLAEALGRVEEARFYDEQARAWRALFDPSTGTLRPKNADGSFLEPFDPDARRAPWRPVRIGGPGYVEGTAWNYAFMVQHDIPGLVALHGERPFVERLQWIFDTGRFEMWNEPDMANPYLFTYVDGEWQRTQRVLRQAIETHYGTGPDGLPGNDDAGAMSAWLVFSALGFYPVAVGTEEYRLGAPLFDRILLQLGPRERAGLPFIVERRGEGPFSRVLLDGEPLPTAAIRHGQIRAGGTLRFE